MPQVSQPRYHVVVEKDVSAQARDGVTLYADIYHLWRTGAFRCCCRVCRTIRIRLRARVIWIVLTNVVMW